MLYKPSTVRHTNAMSEVNDLSKDIKMFDAILSSIGIDKYDPLVPVALNDYARRFAAELLCDAKDYSSHSNKQDTTMEDMKLALKMSDMRVTGVDPRDSIVSSIKDQINKKELFSPVDDRAVLIRYPKDQFTQRSHTFIPGHEAYFDPSSVNTAASASDEQKMVVESSILQQPTAREQRESVTIPKIARGSAASALKPVPGFEDS